ncbi:uracil-DNA glycosylase [Acetobacter lambici]|uniref:Uracil-DNA glycosylase n=1 Tax=Acetobacter lambici TaxID=1332824 RepID=A0ABT1F2F2_9PROT|nr:uracil-DNA glycosylase [Acetobacter lambici]MCP1242282.1 uracil-DNA glycosylase [Acetobacter lambici]MCP1258298.1 uracil-DNA glycosylase [Acetobacter lambici]
MHDALSLLRLYTEWGVDTAVTDHATDHRQSGAGAFRLPQAASPRAPRPAAAPLPYPATPATTSTQAQPTPATGAEVGITSLSESVALARQVAAQAATPHALRAAMEQFDACSLRGTAMHTLIPSGPTNAPLMLIGEAPDADEDRSGHVFSGLCGTLLDTLLAPLPLERDQLALATALPWRPPGGRTPSDAEQRICLPFLQRAITLFAPRRLVLCGRLPATMLLGRDTPTTRREWGTLELPGHGAIPVLAMRHPLQLRASPTARREIWQTLMMVMKTLRDAP